MPFWRVRAKAFGGRKVASVSAADGVALLSTVAIQVPQHARLAADHDDSVVAALIARNWIRTIAWTARGVLLAVVIATTP